MADRKIGYIGLGNMGGGMASHLLASGYDVTVYDIRAEAVQALVDKGATAASSPREVAEQCDVIVSSLPTPQIVESMATGEDGLVHGLSAGKVYIDMSSIDPDTTRRVGAAVQAKGADMLDVPVGMGPQQAATGALTLMIGGSASVVEDCKDVLDTLGDQQFYCGELGLGVTTKIVNNLVSCSVATLLGEAVTMGVAAGLNPERLREVMNNTAASTLHGRTGLKAKVFERNFEPGFKLALSHKDLGLAAQLAASLGAANMVGSAAYQVQTLAMGKGLGNEDQHAAIKVAEETAGVEVKGDGN